ncbi:amidase family protein, partial [Sphingomonas sp. PsM26]|nr:amidase family protein [Sphingomonas sp. PsM26]
MARFDGIRFGHERETFGDEAKRRIMLGTYALSAGYYDEYYLKAEKVRTQIKNEFDNAFKDVDIILGPVSPSFPIKIGEDI